MKAKSGSVAFLVLPLAMVAAAGLALFQATATASASPPADSAAAAMRGVKRIVFTGHSLTFTNWLFYVSIEEI